MQQGRGHYGSFEVVQQQFMVGRAPESHQRIFSVAQDHGAVLPTPALSQQQQQQQLVDQQQLQQEQDQEYHHAQFQQPQTQQQQHQQQSQSNSQHFPDDQQQQVQSYQQAVGQILELGSVSPELHSPLSSRAFHTPFKQQQLVTATRDSTLADHDDDNFEDGEKGSGGNRWPRQETLALIKIRTDLDSSFKDTAVKGPLWEEVSRKLGELGYHRNAKKCKEKFENVHKYYKKTKNGRAGRQDGKHYRFFSELEALFGGLQENSRGSARGLQMVAAAGSQRQQPAAVAENLKTLFDFEDDQRLDHSKKRKRKTFSSSKRQMQSSFENVLKNLMERQEAMQKRFLEGVERRERERLVREEEWKREEIARIDRDMKLQDQERSLAATRDAALVAFLQKLTGKTVHFPPPPPAHPHPSKSLQIVRSDQDAFDPDHRRWPKAEVLALIRLRSGMEGRFQEPGSKAALWEDIANGMSRDLGYNRNSKRCKEKWENINKYFRKTKESNRKRPENAKTCPYFHQLDTLYGTGALNPPTPAAAKPTSKPAEDPPAPDPPTGMMKMLLALSDDHDQICSQGANASSELQPCPENASDHGGQGLQKQN